jgi:hypothetical protein
MACKTTSISILPIRCGVAVKPSRVGMPAGPGGFALTEMMFAMGLTTLLMLVVCSFATYSSRNFVMLANYVEMDDANHLAIDQMTRDLRQSRRLISATTNVIAIEDADGFTIEYAYSPSLRTMSRTKGGISTVLLKQCDTLRFWLGQRNPVGGSYEVYPAATAATAKVVNLSWVCSRTVLGVRANTESVQTARIVIRKQGT